MIPYDQHADEAALKTLLFDSEDGADSAVVASHVESCSDCQARLERLAAAGDDERISQWLSGYRPAEGGAVAGDSVARAGEPTLAEHAREYLGPPSHPEMLGRLGRYEIERAIGAGGMGVVFKGYDAELNRPVAIKVLAKHLARSAAARKRFEREARAAAAIVHEHVVAIHNVEADGGAPFLVMQFVAGESLQARVERTGPLQVSEILRVGAQAAAGLAAAHEQGIIHRDVKPVNILLEHGVERVLLTDFGLARTVDEASLTQSGVIAGTPHYMSPEQANGEAIDPRTDLFSLGAVLYFLATGHPPFRAERPMAVLHRICHDVQRPVWQINPEIPDDLSDLIDKLLAKRPAQRCASALQVRESLMGMLNRLQQRKPTSLARWRRYWRRNGRRLLTATAVVAAIIGVAWCLSFRDGTTDESAKGGKSPTEAILPERLLHEAALGERNEFTSDVSQLRDRLQALEAGLPGAFLRQPDDTWNHELQAMNERLDRLQAESSESHR